MIVKRKDAEKEKTKEEKIDWENLKIPPEIIGLVPYEAAKKYRFVPLEKEGNTSAGRRGRSWTILRCKMLCSFWRKKIS